jgi:hypothetical protein
MRKLIILICLFTFACTSKPKPVIIPLKLQAEELEVIKDTFYDASCCYWQQMEYGFKSDVKESREAEEKRYKIWSDNIYQHLPDKLIWFVKDTLYNPKDFRSSIKYYQNPRIKLDTIFAVLEKDLFTMKYPKQAIRLDGLIVGNFAFESADSLKKLNKIPKRYVAFSRVVFNSKHDKACFYIMQSLPEKYWGTGEMIFAEKKFGKWAMLYRKLYWIA